jgi:hypothetical protein
MNSELARVLREWRLDPAMLREPLAKLGVACVEVRTEEAEGVGGEAE